MRILASVLAQTLILCCVPQPRVVKLAQPTEMILAQVFDGPEGTLEKIPPQLAVSLKETLERRNLVPKVVPHADLAPVFSRLRDSERRLDHLGTLAPALILLVEMRASFYSQLGGRYRWRVHGKLTVAPKSGEPGTLVESFEVAALLQYEHQREAAALAEAAPLVAREVGRLLDTFLRGRGSGAEKSVVTQGEAEPGARKAPDHRADFIYFVLLDRFANGEPANDGEVDPGDQAAWHGGDLAGLMGKLDYLEALGVRTLWLSPLAKARDEPFFGHGAFHGYWVQDPLRVEPRFGQEADLRRLRRELRARKMRLLVDMVLNHVAFDAPLRREHPEWFHNLGPVVDWSDPQQLATHDVHGLPDLAQEREDVYAFLLKVTRRWIGLAEPDGFRLDAVKHIGTGFWRRYTRDVRAYAGENFWMLGEFYDGSPARVAAMQGSGGFDAMFDFAVAFALRDVFCRDAPVAKLGVVMSSDRLYQDPNRLVTFLDNHDLPRVASLCGRDLRRVQRAVTVLFALRGIPALTYGTEVGLTGEKEPDNRGDMVFRATPLAKHIAELARLRQLHPSLAQGRTRVWHWQEGVLALLRVVPNEAAVLVVNQSPIEVTVPLPFRGQARSVARELLRGTALGSGQVAVPAGGVAIAALTPKREGGFSTTSVFTATETQRVHFQVLGAPLGPDDTLMVVGSGPEFGNWDPVRGHGPLHPRAGGHHGWVDLPSSHLFAYKLALRRPNGEIHWERGGDRHLLVGQVPSERHLKLTWDATGSQCRSKAGGPSPQPSAI